MRPAEKLEVADTLLDRRHEDTMNVAREVDLGLGAYVAGGGDGDKPQEAGVPDGHGGDYADRVEGQAPR